MKSDISKNVEQKMSAALEHLKEQFKLLRTSRASTSLVENMMVDYYGTKTLLKQMAQITIPAPNQVAIQPWDKNSLGDIENAIRNSDLNLNPVNDGKIIRLTLPPMTEERRRELTKIVASYAEEAKISVRNARGEAWELIQNEVKSSALTEDDKFALKEELQKLSENYDKQIDDLAKEKETEIMQI
jgi:ribosome recycling factor